MYYCVVKIDGELLSKLGRPFERVDRETFERGLKDLPERYATYAEAEEAIGNLPPLEKGFRYQVSKRGLGWDENYKQWVQRRRKAYALKKDSALTPADVDDIVRGKFAPDVKKLASELEPYLGDPIALRGLGARIVARYGQAGLREVMDRAKIIYGGPGIDTRRNV